MITLYGATGYTGQLIAHALDRARVPFRLAGRSAEKLAQLSAQLSAHPSQLVANVKSESSLKALFDDTALLINCVGPFTELGEPVVAVAAARGVHYLDITNEMAYVYRVQHYHELASRTGAAIVPACGFEVAIADCIVSQLAQAFTEPLEEVAVVYVLKAAGVSIGTRLSGLRTFATSWLAYRDGQLVGQIPGAALRQGQINQRPYQALAFPSAETITLPTHIAARHITTWLAITRQSAGYVRALAPIVSALLRTPLGWVTAQIIQRLLPPAPEAARVKDRFFIQVEMTSRGQRRTQTWSGFDPYRLTADIAVYAAQVMTAPGYARAGVLAPSHALGAEAFLVWLKTIPEMTVSV